MTTWLESLNAVLDAMPVPATGSVSPLPPGTPMCYSIDETAETLHLHVETVRKLCKRGIIPCLKVGARVLIPTLDLQRWLSENVGNNIELD